MLDWIGVIGTFLFGAACKACVAEWPESSPLFLYACEVLAGSFAIAFAVLIIAKTLVFVFK